MAIRSGIGIGEAQVFDTSGLANQYAKQVAADQANLQRQAIANQKRNDEFLKGLADSVSSTKLLGNGLHPEDVKQLTDYQNKTKELYAKASQATNPQERALLKADVDKSIEQQLEYVNGAKFFRQGIGKVTGRMFEHPDEYDDVSRESAKVLNSSSYINALGKGFGVIDDNTFKRRPDQAPLIKAFDDLDKTVKQGAGHDVKKITTENIGGGSFRYKKSIDPLIVLSNAIVKVKSDDGLKHLLKEQYKLANPTATTMPTDEELGNELVNIWKSKKQGQDPYSIVGEPQKVSTAGGAGSDVVVSAPIRLNIPFADGKGSVDVPDYVKLPLPKQNFAGSNYIDMATGKPATDALESSNDYEVVGVGNFPIITKGNMKGSLSQPKFARENRGAVQLKPMVHVQKVTAGGYKEDLLIPYDRLPASAKTKKALANFTPSVGKPTIPTGVKPASTAGKGTEFKSKSGIKVTVE